MKRFIFTDLLVMSTLERSARKIKFHPKTTIIKGPNDTGKSSLVKTLYQAFGANPPNLHRRWKKASVKSLVKFMVDETHYAILHDTSTYTLFSGKNSLLASYNNVTKGLGPHLAKIFDFHLRLPLQKDGGQSPATPAFLFLPFYIDQDMGWNAQWKSFERLGQFGVTRFKDTMEYHTGIRPNEYYTAKGALADARGLQQPVRERLKILHHVLDDLKKKLAATKFDISIEAYANEVEKLLEQSGILREQEESLKKQLVHLYNTRATIRSQINIATRAAQELAKDYEYAVSAMTDAEVDCPTCGAVYENSFRERFSIADDEDSCQQLLTDLRKELHNVEQRLSSVRDDHSRKAGELSEIEKLLEAKQGEITLRQILENEGRKEAQKILERDVKELNAEIGRLDSIIQEEKTRMNRFTDRKRKAEIVGNYAKYLHEYLIKLNLQQQDEKVYKQVDAKIIETGSDLPRALLAYFFSILQVIQKQSSSAFCPIVIDSPNQQDQDAQNLKRIFEFIRAEQPDDSQLILALVDTQGVQFNGETVELKDKYSVLQKEQYSAVAEEMRPFINAAMQG